MIYPLLIDEEAGMATYGTSALEELADKLGAVSVTVGEEHDLIMLCKHPITGVVDYHPVSELMDPEPAKPKLAAV